MAPQVQHGRTRFRWHRWPRYCSASTQRRLALTYLLSHIISSVISSVDNVRMWFSTTFNENNTHFNSETSLQSTTRCDAVLGPGIRFSVDCLYEVQLPHRLRHLCMWKAHSQSIIPFITSHSGQQVYVTFVTHSLIRGFIESIFFVLSGLPHL